MIKQLLLSHFVLVEKAEIAFSPHFNIVTGETGAGKTAIIEAISLALGARADSSLIRQGCERATVQAAFDISASTSLYALLDEAGIDFDRDEDLIVRREITHEGKNKAYINCQLVPLPFLQKVSSMLIDFIGQHAIQELRSSDFQRSLIDLYADLENSRTLFKDAYKREKSLFSRCEELKEKDASRDKNEEILRYQLNEIQADLWKPGEEEPLFEQYRLLAHQKEIAEKLKDILNHLSESPSSVLLQLNRLQKMTDSLFKIDPRFSEPLSLLQQAHIALQEVHIYCNSYSATLDHDTNRNPLDHLEARLSSIAHLKKKYGKTLEEIITFKDRLSNELLEYENLSILFQDTQKELTLAKTQTDAFAQQLTIQRTLAAQNFEQLLTSHLQSLNMSKAELHIEVSAEQRSINGDDSVQFWLKANTGEQSALVREHSSGGELSRLYLAIKLALAEKNQTPTLIFDEIDANVGGKTASIIGEKLAELGKTRQIICITHFPQVAAHAACHFSVHKCEKEGRTITEITPLTKAERQQELLRMMGGEHPARLV